MSISICTMGKYWPQPDGGGLIEHPGSTSSFIEEKRKPVVLINKVIQEEKQKIFIEVTGVYYD